MSKPLLVARAKLLGSHLICLVVDCVIDVPLKVFDDGRLLDALLVQVLELRLGVLVTYPALALI